MKDKSDDKLPPEVLQYEHERAHGLDLNFAERGEISASRITRLALEFDSKVGVPIRIHNATITGELALPGATFAHGFVATGCEFKGPVKLGGATFEGGLDLRGSSFGGEVDFAGAAVKGDCDLTRAAFHEPCRFDDARIAGNLAGAGVKFVKEASFKQAHVSGAVSFGCHREGPAGTGPGGGAGAAPPRVVAATFGGKLDFARAVVEGRASFEGARFEGLVDFQRAHLKHTTDFSSYAESDAGPLLSVTRFLGPADFTACRIGGGAAFLGVYFEKFATFERIEVGGHLLFKPRPTGDGLVASFFMSGASFLCARLQNNAEFDGVSFVGDTTFDHFEVARNAYFRPAFDGDGRSVPAIFCGVADFVGAHIHGDAEFTGAIFWRKVRLESIHVEGNAFFDNCFDSYTAPVRETSPVVFIDEVNLVSAHFRHRATFDRAVFLGPARFESADFEGAALFNGTYFGDGADFTGANFGQYAKFAESTFETAADFTSTRVGGAAFFTQAKMFGPTSFKAASFKSLEFEVVKPGGGRRVFGGDLDLSGFTYELISMNEDLLDDIFASMRVYNRQPLTQLERVLRNIGQDDLADNTYLKRRAKERAAKWERVKKNFKGLTSQLPPPHDAPPGPPPAAEGAPSLGRALNALTGWLFDRAQSSVGNYGIRPFNRLLFISLGVLLIGAVMFWQEGAVVPREKDGRAAAAASGGAPAAPAPTPAKLNFTQALGVSFNQFIPIVQIPSGSTWKPSERLIPLPWGWKFDYFSYAFYGTLHSLLGALLVPLGVAALTGVLHRREKPGK